MSDQTKIHKSFFINVSWIFGSNLFGLFISFIVKTLLARYLGPTGLGYYTLALYFPDLAVLFLEFGLCMSNIYFIGTKKINEQEAFSNSIGFVLIISSLGIIVYLVLLPWLQSVLLKGLSTSMAIVGILCLPFSLMTKHAESILQAKERLREISLVRTVQNIGWLTFILIFVIGLNYDAMGAIVAQLSKNILGLVLLIIILSYLLQCIPALDITVLKRNILFGFKGYLGILLAFLNFRLDFLFVMYFMGPRDVGIYSLAVTIAETLSRAGDSVQAVILPRITLTQGPVELTLKVQTGVTAITSLGALALILLGKPFIDLFFSKTFIDAYTVIVYLCPGIIGWSFAQILNADMAGRGHPLVITKSAAIALPFTIILNPILIPVYGIKGAAITSSISYLVSGIYSSLIFCRLCNVQYRAFLTIMNPVQWWKLVTSYR